MESSSVMKKSSGSFKAFLSYTWQWYLLAAAAIAGIDYGIYAVSHTPKPENTLSVFVGIKSMEYYQMEKDLYAAKYVDTTIEKVSIDHSDPDDFYFGLVFSTRGVVNTDIIILPSQYLGEESYPTYFSPIAEGVLDDYVPNPIGWSDYENVHYGIALGDRLSRYGVGENYYAFFNKKSEKTGAVNPDSQNDFALEALRWIYG